MTGAVVLYTAVGGIKATFLTDFLHTTIAIVLIIYFTLAALTNQHIGGLYGLYDKVAALEPVYHIVGNYKGSLLTFRSKGAIMFSLILKFGNLALVVMVGVTSVLRNALLTRSGHGLLAKVICLGSPRHRPRLRSCGLGYLCCPLGPGDRHWPFRKSYPNATNLSHVS